MNTGPTPDAPEVSSAADTLCVLEDVADQPGWREGHLKPTESGVWHILIVDDDEEVHSTTTFVLQGLEILGRPLQLHHAYSGVNALEVLRRRDHAFAVILLDVVMETEDAGLRTARLIREELGMATVRIILRTGQPGSAPELTVLRDYDINDYRTKTELTRTRLLSSLYVALRSYIYICNLENNRRGLEKIIAGSSELYRVHSLTLFGHGVLRQISSLLEVETSGMVLSRSNHADPDTPAEPVILAAAGPFSDLTGGTVSCIEDQRIRAQILEAFEKRSFVVSSFATALYFPVPVDGDIVTLVAIPRNIDSVLLPLLEVLSANIALGFEHTKMLEHIHNLAFFDELTGLPNRNTFQVETEKDLARIASGNETRKLMIYHLDIDRFQMVNDGLGYGIGDQLLQTIANKLNSELHDVAIVSRIAGDMFGLLAWVNTADDEAILIERVASCFAAPFKIDGNKLAITISGGFVVAENNREAASDVIRHAGIALKSAKRTGRSESLRFSESLANEMKSRLALINQIPEAMAQNQFQLYFQPQIRLVDGCLIGVEALLRWIRPDGVLISPLDFIPAAEESGHILALGEWVLRQACKQQMAWRHSALGRLHVAVNVSLRQLCDHSFTRAAELILAETGADPADVQLEITESTAMDGDYVLTALQNLHGLGFRFAVDDFGTGYSSLARLQQLPVSTLKIDRAFVSGDRPDCRSITSMIIKMGHELGLSVLAEGVETVGQESILKDLGCDSVQGFLYARPMPSEQLIQWFANYAS